MVKYQIGAYAWHDEEHEYFGHSKITECVECIEYHKKTYPNVPEGGMTLESLERAHEWFERVVAPGYKQMSDVMSTPEWKHDRWLELDHGTTEQVYQRCKKYELGPCEPCVQALKAYNKEYRSRPEVIARRKEYNRTNRNKNNKTRFKKLETTPEYSFYSANTVIAKYGNTCHLCGEAIDLSAPRQTGLEGWDRGLHIDHVVPLSKGGKDTLENVRPSHGWCNLSKNNKA
jgi:5-methylcytosine-specific restriction endonuclease McrA